MDRGYATVLPDIKDKLTELEGKYMAMVASSDTEIHAALTRGDVDAAFNMMTNATIKVGDESLQDWLNFWMYLFARCDIHPPLQSSQHHAACPSSSHAPPVPGPAFSLWLC